MSKDKQIDEMRYLADEMGKAISTEYKKRYLADERKLEAVLKENGWRKATEVAEEIFAEIDRMIYRLLNDRHYIVGDMCYEVEELKKKYTQGKEKIPPYVRMDAKALPAILNVKYTEEEE